jgi:hypothetical protein
MNMMDEITSVATNKKVDATKYTSGTEAINKRHEEEIEDFSSSLRAGRFGVSSSTPDRVSTILDQGTPEQIQALRDKGETGEGLGVRTVYEQVQSEKLKSKLQRPTEGQAQQQQEVRRDNLKLINKDFRTVTRDEIPDGSADLVLVLDFPEPILMV